MMTPHAAPGTCESAAYFSNRRSISGNARSSFARRSGSAKRAGGDGYCASRRMTSEQILGIMAGSSPGAPLTTGALDVREVAVAAIPVIDVHAAHQIHRVALAKAVAMVLGVDAEEAGREADLFPHTLARQDHDAAH